MPSEREGSRERGSGCTKGCLGIVAALLLIGVVLVMLAGLYMDNIDQRTGARLESIRGAGEPASLAEIDAWIGPVADEDNAAIPLRKAIDAQREPSNPETQMPFVGDTNAWDPKSVDPLPEEVKAEIAAYLQQEEQSLLAVNEAVARANCRFPINFAMGSNVDLSHLAGLRSLQRVVCLKALYEAELGSSQDATQTLLTACRLSETARREPFLISQLVRIAMHALIVEAVEQCVNRAPFTPDQLKRLQDELQAINTGDCVYTGLLGERCMLLDTLNGGASPGVPNFLVAGWGPLAWRNRIDLEYGLDKLEAMIETAKLPPAEALEKSDDLYGNAKVVDKGGLGRLKSLMTVISDIQIPALRRAMEAQASDTSLLNSSVAACAILRYRQDKGMLPETLNDLVPQYLDKVPVDCMDGKPLRYVRKEAGFTVYSIGPNRIDEGGLPPEEGHRITKMGDMTFSVQPRPAPGT